MTIGIDIDDTITKTTKCVKEHLKKFTNDYDDYHIMPNDLKTEFLTKNLESIHKNCELMENVKDAILYLKERGHKIIIITARNLKYTKNEFIITEEYLKKNGIYYDKIIFDPEESNKKGLKAFENGVDIFIDDKEFVLDDIAEYNITCLRITNDSKSKYKIFKNWDEIIKYFKEKGV